MLDNEEINYDNIKIDHEPKIVYMGTPEFSATVLEGLLTKYRVRAVVTQPDKEVGRNRELRKSPVKEVAEANTILVLQPERIKNFVEEIRAFEPDIIITCAYGQMIPKEILDMPRLGSINVHASLLPRLRGGAPIERSIMEGHSKTGITIMYMDEKMDSGDIIATKELPILDTDTGSILREKLAVVGRDLLLETLPSILDGTNTRTKQDEASVTFAPVIKREDEKIDFSLNKRQVFNKVRALNNFPGAYAIYEGKIMKIYSVMETDNTFTGVLNGTITEIYKEGFGVKVGNGEVVVTELQLEGKKRMSARDFINGNKDIKGKILE